MLALLLAVPARAQVMDLCATARTDNDVAWDGLHHDTFHEDWRAPAGARPAGDTVTLRLRACADDLTGVRLRLWNGRERTEQWLPLTKGTPGDDPVLGPVDHWELELPLPTEPTVLYYFFEVQDGDDIDYFVDDDPVFLGGGFGATVDEWDDSRSFQITVYDPAFTAPAWAEGAVVYQIFPDRFRNGDPSNDPAHDSGFSYGHTEVMLDWGAPFTGRCAGADQERAACYMGGDLQGITDELDMLAELGVDALYLNPIFRSATNHRYDTLDYLAIDDELGTQADFLALASQAEERGISLVLDGVFNHVSADSVYFDLYGRWDSSGALVSPEGPGSWDGSGACESAASPYRDWFTFPATHAPGQTEEGETVLCAADGGGTTSYESWGTYFHIPKLAAERQSVRDLVYARPDSAAVQWLQAGAKGWRLDVSGEVDPGAGHDVENDFWEGFHDATQSTEPEVLIVGEVWGDASPWLVGGEWHATMNYRLRSAVLDWLFDACSPGNGCADGTWFQENDSSPWRESGTVDAIDEDTLKLRLLSILEDTPPTLWHVQMNLLGSHDVSRLRWMLTMGSAGDAALARGKQELAALLVYTWPGMPTVYYGDEVGVDAASQWDGGTHQDDPWNRVAYPWAELGGSPDTALFDWYARLAALRHDSPALMRGDVRFVTPETAEPSGARLLAFVRELPGEDAALVVLNRGTVAADVVVPVGETLAENTQLEDVLTGDCVPVVDGTVGLRAVPELGGVVLRAGACGAGPGDSGAPVDSGEPDDGTGGGGSDGGSQTETPREEAPAAEDGGSGGGEKGSGCSTGGGALWLGWLAVVGVGSRRRGLGGEGRRGR